MFKLKTPLLARKTFKRKTPFPVQTKTRRVTDSKLVEEKRPNEGFSPPDTIDTGFTPYFKGSAPFNEKAYLANMTTPTPREKSTNKTILVKIKPKAETKEPISEEEQMYGEKVDESTRYKPKPTLLKKPYGGLKKQPEGALSDSFCII